MALKKHDLAIDAFRLTIRALDESKLTAEKRQKWQKDIQIMLLMLQKNQEQGIIRHHLTQILAA